MDSVAFRFADLSYAYPGSKARAVDCVNLSVTEGETFALLGPNGSGKTTLLRILCGRISPLSGNLSVAREFQNPNGGLDLSKCGVLIENPGVYPKLSIAEYLAFFAGFYNVRNVDSEIRALAQRLELPPVSVLMGSLSQGTRQKVQIARALLHRPRLLLLDEPVANLDPNARDAVWGLLTDWKRECGGTLLVSSHILSEMESVATSFAILYKGKLLHTQRISALATDECVLRVRLPKGCSASDVLSGIPAGTVVLKAEAGRKSLDSVYREVVRDFESAKRQKESSK